MKTIDEECGNNEAAELVGMQAMNAYSDELVAIREQNLDAINDLCVRTQAAQQLLDKMRYMISRSVVRDRLPQGCLDYREDAQFVQILANFGMQIVDNAHYRNEYDIAAIGCKAWASIGDQLQSQSIPRTSDFSVGLMGVKQNTDACCQQSPSPTGAEIVEKMRAQQVRVY